MENDKRWFQFSLRWLMIQTSLAAVALALILAFPRFDRDTSEWCRAATFAIILTTTGAMVGGCFGDFRIGAAIGFMHGLILLAIIVLYVIALGSF